MVDMVVERERMLARLVPRVDLDNPLYKVFAGQNTLKCHRQHPPLPLPHVSLCLDSADQGHIPPWQRGELLDTKGDGGDGEAGQSVRGLTDWVIETGHIGLH